MSVALHVYVGPYLKAPVDFEWYEHDSLVRELENRFADDCCILVPNCDVDGIDRELEFHRTGGDYPVIPVGADVISAEIAAFASFALPVALELGTPAKFEWGIVPYWY